MSNYDDNDVEEIGVKWLRFQMRRYVKF